MATLSTTPPRVVPTISQPVRISWADWGEQLLVHETPLIEAAAEVAAQLGLSTIPVVGPIVAKLVGPTVVKQIVDQGLQLFEATLAKIGGTTIDKPTWLQNFAVETINTIAPKLAGELGATLNPLIADAIAKVTPALKLDVPAPDLSGVPTTSRGR